MGNDQVFSLLYLANTAKKNRARERETDRKKQSVLNALSALRTLEALRNETVTSPALTRIESTVRTAEGGVSCHIAASHSSKMPSNNVPLLEASSSPFSRRSDPTNPSTVSGADDDGGSGGAGLGSNGVGRSGCADGRPLALGADVMASYIIRRWYASEEDVYDA